ncbi:MAG TPA: carboxypeptidase regulatory-like domain-containing protein [Blastocatellia bacterium]|nr:carboxypeptidase regulatory-like domain-containing protein [Blastocatellia bacterium]
MKPVRLNLFSALSILILMAVSQSGAQTPQRDNRPRTASISGRVTIGGAPAANALMIIAEVDPQSRGAWFRDESPQSAFIKVRTDNDGRYRVAGLAEGNYMIRALSKVYVRSERGSEYETYRSVTLDEGESRDNVDFALVRGGVITGRVIDAEGRPLIESFLQLQPVDENGRPKGGVESNLNRMMQTDDRGVYRIYGLPAGRYILSAGGELVRNRAKRKYPQTFYPEATDPNQAKIIEVKEGAEVTDINIRLGAEKNIYDVAGKVVDAETGQPLPQIELRCLELPDSENGARYGGKQAITDSEGKFIFLGLEPGRYELNLWNYMRMARRLSAPKRNDEYYSEKTLFEVKNSDLNGMEIKAIRGSTVSGGVILEGANDPALKGKLQRMVISLLAASAGYPALSIARTADDGSFRLTGIPPGRATFSLENGQDGIFSIKRIERDGAEIRSGMEIGRSEQITGVRIVVSHANGTIRGQVEIAGPKLPEGGRLQIWVSPAKTTDGDEGAQAVYSQSKGVLADEKGRFLIERLAAGEYDLTLHAMVRVSEQYWSHAPGESIVWQRVTVSSGAETTVKLTLDLTRK